MILTLVHLNWNPLHGCKLTMSERRAHEAAGMGLPCSSGTTVHHGLGTGRSKYYPSDSARFLLKECFADNPPLELDPHQHLTGMG